MAGFDLQLDNDGTYSVATFFYFCVQIGIGLVVLFRYMVMRPVDMKKILFVFLIIGSFVIARRYSGADALLETRLLIAGANDIDYRKILKVYLIVEIPMTICTMIADIQELSRIWFTIGEIRCGCHLGLFILQILRRVLFL